MKRIHGLIVVCAAISALSGCLSIPPEEDAVSQKVQEPYPDPILSGRPVTPAQEPNLPTPETAPDPPPKEVLQTASGLPADAAPDRKSLNGTEPDEPVSGALDEGGHPELPDQASLPPPDAVEPLDPNTLIGSERDDIRLRFGEPDKEEERTPGFVWHYSRAECDLSLFFYLDVKSNTYRMLTYELLSQVPQESGISQGGTNDADRIEQCYRRFGNASG